MTAAAATRLLERLERDDVAAALAAYLPRQRWFGGRGRELEGVHVVEAVLLAGEDARGLWTVLADVAYAGGDHEMYHLLLVRRLRPPEPADAHDHRMLVVEGGEGEPVVLQDAFSEPDALEQLWQAVRDGATLEGAHGAVHCENLRLDAGGGRQHHVRPLGREQSNSSAVLDDRELLKCLRKVAAGVSPELEMTQALAVAGFDRAPVPLGFAEYRPQEGEPVLLALVQPFLHNGTEGWTLALTSLRALYADVEEAMLPGESEDVDPRSLEQRVVEHTASFVPEAARIGTVTAEMHLALLDGRVSEGVRARPTERAELQAWAAEMSAELDALLRRGEDAGGRLTPLREAGDRLRALFGRVGDLSSGGMSVRVHGDYHLGQLLRVDEGWVILDFEGEPNLPLAGRRQHSSALRDVAGMLRSFDYAAAAALTERAGPDDPLRAPLRRWADAWARANSGAFWDAYMRTVEGSPLLPPRDGALTLRRAFEVRKAVYEVGYELGHRPDWVDIPLRFLLSGDAT